MVPQTSPLRGLPVASTRLIPEDLEGIALNSVEGASISQLDLLAECPIESAVSFSLSYEASTLWLISMVWLSFFHPWFSHDHYYNEKTLSLIFFPASNFRPSWFDGCYRLQPVDLRSDISSLRRYDLWWLRTHIYENPPNDIYKILEHLYAYTSSPLCSRFQIGYLWPLCTILTWYFAGQADWILYPLGGWL